MDYFTGNKAAKKSDYCSLLKDINQTYCINLIQNMMQHFALNLDMIVSILSTSVAFWSQSVFVIIPQGAQERKDPVPASVNFQDGFEYTAVATA